MTCPFLIVEAKKESGSPGFRSVERQTAFPIRRLLRLQAHVLESSKVAHEPPLVWFFAYQGEEWRLYAGTLESRERSRSSSIAEVDDGRLKESQVVGSHYDAGTRSRLTKMQCVYDLWHGTIESQDGALQLLQIVDHIWTWARDIYRPGVITCLQTLNNREASPASPVQFYSTPSIRSNSMSLSIRSHGNTPPRQLHNTFQRDQTASAHTSEPVSRSRQRIELESTRYRSAGPSKDMRDVIIISDEGNEQVEARPGVIRHHQNPQDGPARASIPAHPISKWAALHSESAELSSFATVCHANTARFTFRIREITDFEVYLSSGYSEFTRKERWQLMDIYPISTRISRGTLSRFETYWTQRHLGEPVSSPHEVVRATIFFHTYLEQTNWEIVREIVCVIWPTKIVDEDGKLVPLVHIPQIDIDRLFQWSFPLKRLSGSQSVLCAHNDYTLLPNFDHFRHSGNSDDRPVMMWQTSSDVLPSGIKLMACIKLLKDDALFAFTSNVMHAGDLEPIRAALTKTPTEVSGILPGFPDTTNHANSFIAIKPSSWPMRTARFCLFVLQEEGFDSAKVLRQLLQDAVRNENMIGHRSEFLLTKEEQAGISRWEDWLLAFREDYPIM
jgi:hypothetical protein